jgi:hypothetical protein
LAQEIVDPGAIGTPVREDAIAILPHAARRFGYVPDFSLCLPGDLVLFRHTSPGYGSRAIASAQIKGGFGPEHGQWTHAGVYLYDDLVVEAVPWHGVRQRSLHDDVPSRILRIRRAPRIQVIERYRVALRALSMLNTRYGYWSAFGIGRRMWHGLWNPTQYSTFGGALICSQVFNDAHADITLRWLRGCPPSSPVAPAHLSATIDLDDVPIGWVKLK